MSIRHYCLRRSAPASDQAAFDLDHIGACDFTRSSCSAINVEDYP
jgi:hypothetical protein